MRRAARIAAALIAALLLAACGVHLSNSGGALRPVPDGALRVATHNVHYIRLRLPEGRWGLSGWEARKGPLDAAFKSLDADLVAFQEMESFGGGDVSGVNLARDWLLSRNPGYRAAATGDPRRFPATQPILYRTDRLRVLEEGWFFFSTTPDTIYSRTFDGSYPAFASWARFETREGARLRVVNVHYDYASDMNRRLSSDLVAARIAPWIAGGESVVLLGDLNVRFGAPPMRTLSEAGLRFLPVPGSTYHLDRGLNLFGAIDHVAISEGLVALGRPMVLRERHGRVWPSDHYPVAADLAVR